MMNYLFKLSDNLKKSGFDKEASKIDVILKEAFDVADVSGWFRKKYNQLKEKFNRKEKAKGTPEAVEADAEYEEERTDALEEILEKKEVGPPEKQLYYWYTHPFESGCPVCASRHGLLRTLAEWRTLGFPGRTNSSCIKTPRCNCFLIRLKPGGIPGSAKNEDGAFDISNLIGLQPDGSVRNMQQGAMFTAEQHFNNNMEES